MVLFRTLLGGKHLMFRIRSIIPQCSARYASDKPVKVEDLTFLPKDEAELEEEFAAREAKIARMQDRSGLKKHHRTEQNDLCPDDNDDPTNEYSTSVKYRRILYGKFGKSSGVNPGILWPGKEELDEMKVWEETAHPYTASELIARSKQRIKEDKEETERKQEEVLQRVERMKQEILDFQAKVSIRLDKEVAAKERQEKLMKELRKHFGYTIAPNDPRVAVWKEKQALEEKKAKKEAKKKKKAEIKQKLLEKTMGAAEGEESKKEEKD